MINTTEWRYWAGAWFSWSIPEFRWVPLASWTLKVVWS